jgi:Outer membrane lipoprotein-sorting protein
MRYAMSEPTRRALLLGLTCGVAGAALAQPAAVPRSAQQILEASDAVRNPGRPFMVELELLEYRKGAAVERSQLVVFAKAREGTGQFRSIVRFAAPARDLDKLMLKDGNDLWFYDPNTKATVRVAPQQRLLGQVSNGDVVTANLALDYGAVEASVEDVDDGDRTRRRSHRLRLESRTADAVYGRIDLWVDHDTFAPIKARFLTDAGRVLKTAFYRKYRDELGASRPTETVVIDGIDHQWITVLRYANFAFKDIPESWLQREYLPNFAP